jgi:hypothetical protein
MAPMAIIEFVDRDPDAKGAADRAPRIGVPRTRSKPILAACASDVDFH